MWQPNGSQWRMIWTAAIVLILAWPPSDGSSLAAKIARWVVDPAGTLPALPAPLPMGLDDDGDAVAAHDALEAEYYRRRDRSAITRWRMGVKAAHDPFDPTTERQLLVGVAALAALVIWRLS